MSSASTCVCNSIRDAKRDAFDSIAMHREQLDEQFKPKADATPIPASLCIVCKKLLLHPCVACQSETKFMDVRLNDGSGEVLGNVCVWSKDNAKAILPRIQSAIRSSKTLSQSQRDEMLASWKVVIGREESGSSSASLLASSPPTFDWPTDAKAYEVGFFDSSAAKLQLVYAPDRSRDPIPLVSPSVSFPSCTLLTSENCANHRMHIHCASGWLNSHQSCPCNSQSFAKAVQASPVTVRVYKSASEFVDISSAADATFAQFYAAFIQRCPEQTSATSTVDTAYFSTGVEGKRFWSSDSKCSKVVLRDFAIGSWKSFQVVFGFCSDLAHAQEWSLNVAQHVTVKKPSSASASGVEEKHDDKEEVKNHSLTIESTASLHQLKLDLQSVSHILRDKQLLWVSTTNSSNGAESRINIDDGSVSRTPLLQLGLTRNSVVHVKERDSFPHVIVDAFTVEGVWLNPKHVQQATDGVCTPSHLLSESGVHHSNRWSLISADAALQSELKDDAPLTLQDVVGCSIEWFPTVIQSDKGMACFLSCLYMLSTHLVKNTALTQRTIGHFRSLGATAAACYALYLLSHQRLRLLTVAYKTALSNSCLTIMQSMLKQANIHVEAANVFEYARVFLSSLISESTVKHAITETFVPLPINPDDGSNPVDATMMDHQSANKPAVHPRLKALRAVMFGNGASTNKTEANIWKCDQSDSTIAANPSTSGPSATATPASTAAAAPWREWVRQVDSLNVFRVCAVDSLSEAPKPSLTLDKRAHLAVYDSQGKGAERLISLFCPLLNDSISISLDQLREALKGQSTDDVVAVVDDRDPEEGVLLVIDTSQSMNQKADFVYEEGDDEEDKNGSSDEDDEDSDDEDEYDEFGFKKKNSNPEDKVLPTPLTESEVEKWIGSTPSDEDIIAVRAAVEWIRNHSCLDQMKRIVQFHSVGGHGIHSLNEGFVEILQYMMDELPHTRPHVRNISKFSHAFLSFIQQGKSVSNSFFEVVDKKFAQMEERVVAEKAAKAQSASSKPEQKDDSLDEESDLGLFSLAPSKPAATVAANKKSDEEKDREDFLCCICYDLMTEAVVANDGFSYCRECISKWFDKHETSPMTGSQLGNAKLTPNHNLRSQINEYKQKQDSDKKSRFAQVPPRDGNLTFAVRNTTTANIITLNGFTPQHRVRDIKLVLENEHSALPEDLQRLTCKFQTLADDTRIADIPMLMKDPPEQILQMPSYSMMSFGKFGRRKKITVKILFFNYRAYCEELCFQSFSDDDLASIKMRISACIPMLDLSGLEFWYNMRDVGDRQYCGSKCSSDALSLSSMFNRTRPAGFGNNDGKYVVTEKMMSDEPNTMFLHLCQKTKKKKKKSGSSKKKKKVKSLTRLETVKQLFNSFLNRSLAYAYPCHIGLLTFNDKSRIKLMSAISPRYEAFRSSLDKVTATGDTALFDALTEAAEHLLQWQQSNLAKHKNAKLRIICLSDGKDSSSTNESWEVARLLRQHDICLDVIQIGAAMNYNDDMEVMGIVRATDGYCFHPRKLVDALSLCELETMLSQKERPAPVYQIRPIRTRFDYTMLHAQWRMSGKDKKDPCSNGNFPPRKTTYDVDKPVSTLESAVVAFTPKDNSESVAAPSALNTKRIWQEMRDLQSNPHPAYEVFPNTDNIAQWACLMEGPGGTPYANGCWLLSIQFGAQFPLVAPEVRFLTPIKHCNINVHGRVCHSIFNRAWSAETSVKMLLDCVFGLLLSPDTNDPLDSVLAMSFYSGTGVYETSIVEFTKKHASDTRQEWKKRLLLSNEDEEEADHELEDSSEKEERPSVKALFKRTVGISKSKKRGGRK